MQPLLYPFSLATSNHTQAPETEKANLYNCFFIAGTAVEGQDPIFLRK